MLLEQLRRHIKSLASLDENEAPVLSCYVDLEEKSWRARLDERVATLRRVLPGGQRRFFEQALEPVDRWLASSLQPEMRGAAVFSRGGSKPHFTAMQFGAQLPLSVSLRPAPHIYHLVELKETYDRYVVVLVSRQGLRIMDVNLGSVTKQICRDWPQLMRRISSDWARSHYASRGGAVLDEAVRVLDKLVASGGHSYIVLAGPSQRTSAIARALPRHLSAKIIGTLAARDRDTAANIVAASMTAFALKEEFGSREVAARLLRELRVDGLAVAGLSASMAALRAHRAETLVLVSPRSGEAADLLPETEREAAVRIAERGGCHVEVVNNSPELLRVGGIGCLLRYRMDAPQAQAAAMGA